MNKDLKQSSFWNIVKGIGIFSIVIGHTCEKLSPYVYLYHLVLFFFVSGYLYSEEKYGDDPFYNLGQRIKSSWFKYVIYVSIFILLHNVFIKIGIIESTPYTPYQMFANVISSVIFICNESMGGALWFVNLLIFASGLFGGCIYLGRKSQKLTLATKIKPIKDIVIIILTIICGTIGVLICLKNNNLMFHLQISFLVVPIYTLAYYTKRYIKDLNKILKWYFGITAIVILILMVRKLGWQIELSENIITGPWQFYVISIIGIYGCLYLTKIISKTKILNKYFSFIGKYSFDIMALHFLVVKIIDVIYAHINNISDRLIYTKFPCAFQNLWLVYAILGTIIPALFIHYINKVNEKIKNKIYENN